VHSGFLEEWESLRECVEGSLTEIGSPKGSEIRATGHSLGGAVSSLAMVALVDHGWYIKEGYNFGMPRVGDAEFAKTFDSLFDGRFFRVTHHMDPVPHVPPTSFGFQHVSTEVFYNGDVNGGYSVCPATEDQNCSGQYWNVVHDALHIGDHMDYMGEQTGSAGCTEALSQLKENQTAIEEVSRSSDVVV